MKKITLIVFALIGYTCMSQSYKSHVFYSIIDNQGTITENLASQNCTSTFTPQQLRGRFYVNISITTPLQPHKFYQLDFGRGLNYYYLTYSGTNEHPDEDYRITAQSASIVQYDCDSDGDGVSDSQDNCPNDPGPTSNNGCPTTPEVSLIKAQISQSGNTWNVLSNQWPLIAMNWSSFGNPTTTFRFTLKNTGGTNYGQGNREIDVHMSDKAVLGAGPIQLFNIHHGNFSQIPTNGTFNINFDRNLSAAPNPTTGAFALFENKTYYFHFIITADYASPSRQSYVFPFRVNRLDINNLTFDLSSLPKDPTPEPYMITVYDFSGQKVLSKEVIGIAEENEILLNLPTTGIYIIESNGISRKVHINRN